MKSPACIVVAASALLAQTPAPEGLEFFENRIRPVLVKNCYMCHSRQAKVAQGGLVVDTRDAIRRGGQSGPAVTPGNAAASLLLKVVHHDGKIKMPPMGKLPDAAIADLERWVEMGAPDPRVETAAPAEARIDLKKGREFWAFQAPRPPAPPSVKRAAWPAGAIDRFILAKLEAAGLSPVADADRRTLIRRASFDLTGLPPTPEEVEAFVNDKSKDAYPKVVDRLLASERFGERWGRHWLDVARYAETIGRTRNFAFPVAWRYRDYVIRAFNQDKPYNQFVREQLAGDLMKEGTPTERNERLIATGFLAMGAHDLNEADAAQAAMDVLDEQINVTTRAMLGLTVGCARCHDHKFDPIPTRDYYAIAGIFRSTEMLSGLRRRPIMNGAYFNLAGLSSLEGVEPYSGPGGPQVEARRAALMEELAQAERARDRPAIRQAAQKIGRLPLPANVAMGVREAARMQDCEVNIRGDAHSLGAKVPRGFLNVLFEENATLPAIAPNQSGRLQFADWMTRPDNPLTARVMVNRIWQHVFGEGIVDTVDNFGKSGSRPSHPELLDYLAARFVRQGWSVKTLIREMMLSHTYRLAGDFQAHNFEVEPDNRLLWRANRRRLEVEAIRDAMLAVSGELKLDPPAASPAYSWPKNLEVNRRGLRIEPWEIQEKYRSVYLPVVRNAVSRFFETFDFPEPSETHGRRDVTTVPPQALLLMNSPFVLEQARTAAERLMAREKTDVDRVRAAYARALARAPSNGELDQAVAFVRGLGDAEGWTRLYHALFASTEFRYRI